MLGCAGPLRTVLVRTEPEYADCRPVARSAIVMTGLKTRFHIVAYAARRRPPPFKRPSLHEHDPLIPSEPKALYVAARSMSESILTVSAGAFPPTQIRLLWQ